LFAALACAVSTTSDGSASEVGGAMGPLWITDEVESSTA
jgi:hypothetical protein